MSSNPVQFLETIQLVSVSESLPDSITFEHTLPDKAVGFGVFDLLSDSIEDNLFDLLDAQIESLLDNTPGWWEDASDGFGKLVDPFGMSPFTTPSKSKPENITPKPPKTSFDPVDRTEAAEDFNRFDLDIE